MEVYNYWAELRASGYLPSKSTEKMERVCNLYWDPLHDPLLCLQGAHVDAVRALILGFVEDDPEFADGYFRALTQHFPWKDGDKARARKMLSTFVDYLKTEKRDLLVQSLETFGYATDEEAIRTMLGKEEADT